MKKVTALLLTACVLGGFFIAKNQENVPISYAETEPPGGTWKVVAYCDGNGEYWTEDGDVFVVHGLPFEEGDGVILTLNHMGTPTMEDDEVVSVKAKPRYYDVPLSEDLQEHIIKICEQDKYKCQIGSMHLELILAIIEKESTYNTNAVGDDGESFGLMQVKESDHRDRMEKLGVTDLMDPYQNVIVGIDILNEKLLQYDTFDEALTAYNAGDAGAEAFYFSQGIAASPYTEEVWHIWRRICLSHCE